MSPHIPGTHESKHFERLCSTGQTHSSPEILEQHSTHNIVEFDARRGEELPARETAQTLIRDTKCGGRVKT
eukprot:1593411-Rhodomonas_salina.2